jgi:hypothetical protein
VSPHRFRHGVVAKNSSFDSGTKSETGMSGCAAVASIINKKAVFVKVSFLVV